MIIRQSINFAAHLAAGIVFGALTVIAIGALRPKVNTSPAQPPRSDVDESR